MSKGIKVVEAENAENIEVVVKKEGIVSKAKNLITKHGKKIGAIALAAAVGGVGYALGKKSSSDTTEEESDEQVETDYFVVDDVETEEI